MNRRNHLINKLSKIKWYNLLKWLFLLLSYGYLTYILQNYKQYDKIGNFITSLHGDDYFWLTLSIVLLPLNLYIESVKWIKITSKTENLSLQLAFKAVIAGFSTGFLTPNRTGDFIGRIMFLNSESRKKGVMYTIVNGITQSLAIIVCGIPALYFFYLTVVGKEGTGKQDYVFILSLSILFCLISILLLYQTPRYLKKINNKKISDFTEGISLYKRIDLTIILAHSFLRFFVFCIQLWAMLAFFGIPLSFEEASMSIPANYLIVTIVPTMAFSDVTVRSSSAVLILGFITNKTINLALAGASLWVINYAIPMIVGSVILILRKN